MKFTSDRLQQNLFTYYDKRSSEYDEIYVGKGPAIPDPEVYKRDVGAIIKIAMHFGNGKLYDIGCGTGFWSQYYGQNCAQITLLDQSEKMLIACKRRIDDLGLREKCFFIRGDFFEVCFNNFLFESAFVGFFLSHLSLTQEHLFFTKLNQLLKINAKVMFIDSSWSAKRQRYRNKQGLQERKLNDGRVLTIYKRYFDQLDIYKIFENYGFTIEKCYTGDLFGSAVSQKK